jgi:hypothetical protein
MGNLPVKPTLPSNLDEYVEPINTYHRAAQAAAGSAVQYAWATGRLLNGAEARCKHGEWLPWLKANFEGSRQTADRYRWVAANYPDPDSFNADFTINAALRAIEEKKNGGKPKAPKPPAPSQEPMEVEVDDIEDIEIEDIIEKFEDEPLTDGSDEIDDIEDIIEVDGELVEDEVGGLEVDEAEDYRDPQDWTEPVEVQADPIAGSELAAAVEQPVMPTMEAEVREQVVDLIASLTAKIDALQGPAGSMGELSISELRDVLNTIRFNDDNLKPIKIHKGVLNELRAALQELLS